MRTLTQKRVQRHATAQKLPASLKRLPGMVKIPKMPKCIVGQCFTDKSVFAYRDSDLDNLLPTTLKESGETKVSGYELTKVTTEADLAKVGGKFTNLLQIEDLILRTEKGENTGLITNGYANIFFLGVGNSVFAVDAYRDSGGWYIYCDRFRARDAWSAGRGFFSPAT